MAVSDLSRLGFAFTAGAFAFFAPCAYPLLPGYVSYYLGRSSSGARHSTGEEGTWSGGTAPGSGRSPTVCLLRAGGVGLLVSLGFFAVYAALVGTVAALGARFLAGISILELVVGGVLILVGVAMALGWNPRLRMVRLPGRRRSAAGYVGFGVAYAAAAAGCTAPIFVGVVLEALSAGPATSIAAFVAYASGMSVVMVGVTVLAALGRETLLSRIPRRMGSIHRIAGVLLIVAGTVQVYFFLFRFDGLAMLGMG
ncbi:MAG: cytochrome c biogenesis CcdA family protein [Halobacteriales archaeon]